MSVFSEFTVSVSYLGFFAFPYVNFPFSSQIIVLKVSCSLSQVAVFVFSSIHIQGVLLFSSLCHIFLARSKDCYWLFLAVPNYRSVHFLLRFGSLFYRLFLSKANNRYCRFFSPNLLLVIVSSLVSQFFCNGHLVLLISNEYRCRQFSSCPMRGPVFLSTSRRRCRGRPFRVTCRRSSSVSYRLIVTAFSSPFWGYRELVICPYASYRQISRTIFAVLVMLKDGRGVVSYPWYERSLKLGSSLSDVAGRH